MFIGKVLLLLGTNKVVKIGGGALKQSLNVFIFWPTEGGLFLPFAIPVRWFGPLRGHGTPVCLPWAHLGSLPHAMLKKCLGCV